MLSLLLNFADRCTKFCAALRAGTNNCAARNSRSLPLGQRKQTLEFQGG